MVDDDFAEAVSVGVFPVVDSGRVGLWGLCCVGLEDVVASGGVDVAVVVKPADIDEDANANGGDEESGDEVSAPF